MSRAISVDCVVKMEKNGTIFVVLHICKYFTVEVMGEYFHEENVFYVKIQIVK